MFDNVRGYSTMFDNVWQCLAMFRNVQECSGMFENVRDCSRMFENVRECSGMYGNVRECSIMLRKVLWWVVSSNYSIISGPDLLNLRFEFELERSSETSRDDLELVWTRAWQYCKATAWEWKGYCYKECNWTLVKIKKCPTYIYN